MKKIDDIRFVSYVVGILLLSSGTLLYSGDDDDTGWGEALAGEDFEFALVYLDIQKESGVYNKVVQQWEAQSSPNKTIVNSLFKTGGRSKEDILQSHAMLLNRMPDLKETMEEAFGKSHQPIAENKEDRLNRAIDEQLDAALKKTLNSQEKAVVEALKARDREKQFTSLRALVAVEGRYRSLLYAFERLDEFTKEHKDQGKATLLLQEVVKNFKDVPGTLPLKPVAQAYEALFGHGLEKMMQEYPLRNAVEKAADAMLKKNTYTTSEKQVFDAIKLNRFSDAAFFLTYLQVESKRKAIYKVMQEAFEAFKSDNLNKALAEMKKAQDLAKKSQEQELAQLAEALQTWFALLAQE